MYGRYGILQMVRSEQFNKFSVVIVCKPSATQLRTSASSLKLLYIALHRLRLPWRKHVGNKDLVHV